MAKLITKVTSINDLQERAGNNPRYLNLAISAAKNIGGMKITNLESAIAYLKMHAAETDEEGVVGEVNFCRDLV